MQEQIKIVETKEEITKLTNSFYKKEEININLQKCQICNKYSRYTCGKCISVFYCSLQCQQMDWILHVDTCKIKNISHIEKNVILKQFPNILAD